MPKDPHFREPQTGFEERVFYQTFQLFRFFFIIVQQISLIGVNYRGITINGIPFEIPPIICVDMSMDKVGRFDLSISLLNA